jgi:hypothetical protein
MSLIYFVQKIKTECDSMRTLDPSNPPIPDCIFESSNEFEIPNLLLEKQAWKLILPFEGYGSVRRILLAQT